MIVLTDLPSVLIVWFGVLWFGVWRSIRSNMWVLFLTPVINDFCGDKSYWKFKWVLLDYKRTRAPSHNRTKQTKKTRQSKFIGNCSMLFCALLHYHMTYFILMYTSKMDGARKEEMCLRWFRKIAQFNIRRFCFHESDMRTSSSLNLSSSTSFLR